MWGRQQPTMRTASLYLWRWSIQAVVAAISLSLHVAPALGLATCDGGRCTSLLVRQGFVGRGCLRGGGVFDGVDDKVTPEQIREIGEDVLKMWEVSHKETLGEDASTGAAGALRVAASLRGASGSDELASLTKRSPSSDTKATSGDQPEDGAEDAEGPQKWSDDHQAASAQGKCEHQTLDLVDASIRAHLHRMPALILRLWQRCSANCGWQQRMGSRMLATPLIRVAALAGTREREHWTVPHSQARAIKAAQGQTSRLRRAPH